MLDGLYAVRDRVQLVTCRFEAGAVNAAEAYASSPGAPPPPWSPAAPAPATAPSACTSPSRIAPHSLLFVGQIPFAETDRESFQEVDYRRMFAPLAKWVTQIDDAERIPEIVAHAVDVATTGRPGPVVIALSEEMQKHLVEVPDIGPAAISRPQPDPAALQTLAALLDAAHKPLAILGGGGWTAAGRAAITRFLTGQNLPTTAGFRRMALYDGTLPNYAGDLGVGPDRPSSPTPATPTSSSPSAPASARPSPRATPCSIRRAAPPSSTSIRTRRKSAACSAPAWASPPTSTPSPPPPPRSPPSPAPGPHGPPNSAPPASAAAFPPRPPTRSTPPPRCASLRPSCRPTPSAPATPGNFAGWPQRFINFAEHQRFIGPTNGAMGYAVPAAVGAKIAFPDRTVVAFVGDGGFLMTGQEIATAFHHGVAPIVLVFNNQMYGTHPHVSGAQLSGRVSGTALTNPDFARLIEAFGGHGETVTTTAEFAPAFRRAVASGRPAVIELVVDPEQITTRATIAHIRAGTGGVKPAAAKPPAKPPAKPRPGHPAPPRQAVNAPAGLALSHRDATRILLPFSLIIFLGYSAVGIPIATLPLHVHDALGYGTTMVGVVMGLGPGVTLLTRQLAGRLADRRGPKAGVLIGLATCASSGLAYLLATALPGGPALAALLAGRALVGLGDSLFTTAMMAWMIARVGPTHAGRAMAWTGLAMYAALAVGAPAGAVLGDSGGFATVCVAVAALPLVGMLVAATMTGLPGAPSRPASFAGVIGRMWPPGLCLVLASGGFGTIAAFLALRFADLGWSGAGLALSAFGGAYILSRLFFAGLPDRLGGVRVAVACLTGEAAGLTLIATAPTPLIAIAGTALTGLGYSLVFPALGVEVVRRVPPESRGIALGLFLACFDAGLGGAGPVMGLVASGFGLPAAFFAAAAAALVSLALVWTTRTRT